jgi:hypothetical protein
MSLLRIPVGSLWRIKDGMSVAMRPTAQHLSFEVVNLWGGPSRPATWYGGSWVCCPLFVVAGEAVRTAHVYDKFARSYIPVMTQDGHIGYLIDAHFNRDSIWIERLQ